MQAWTRVRCSVRIMPFPTWFGNEYAIFSPFTKCHIWLHWLNENICVFRILAHTFAFYAESFRDWSWFGPIRMIFPSFYSLKAIQSVASAKFHATLFSPQLDCFAVGTFKRFHSIYFFRFSYLQCSIKSILDQGCFVCSIWLVGPMIVRAF